MDEPSGKEWSKRYSWANCREPFKTELETLASHWIEGALSPPELALELWDFWSELKFVEKPSKTLSTVPLLDVNSQLEVLVQAMRMGRNHPSTSPKERRDLLDNARSFFGNRDEPKR